MEHCYWGYFICCCVFAQRGLTRGEGIRSVQVLLLNIYVRFVILMSVISMTDQMLTDFSSFQEVPESEIKRLILKSSNKFCNLDPIPTSLIKTLYQRTGSNFDKNSKYVTLFSSISRPTEACNRYSTSKKGEPWAYTKKLSSSVQSSFFR